MMDEEQFAAFNSLLITQSKHTQNAFRHVVTTLVVLCVVNLALFGMTYLGIDRIGQQMTGSGAVKPVTPDELSKLVKLEVEKALAAIPVKDDVPEAVVQPEPETSPVEKSPEFDSLTTERSKYYWALVVSANSNLSDFDNCWTSDALKVLEKVSFEPWMINDQNYPVIISLILSINRDSFKNGITIPGTSSPINRKYSERRGYVSLKYQAVELQKYLSRCSTESELKKAILKVSPTTEFCDGIFRVIHSASPGLSAIVLPKSDSAV